MMPNTNAGVHGTGASSFKRLTSPAWRSSMPYVSEANWNSMISIYSSAASRCGRAARDVARALRSDFLSCSDSENLPFYRRSGRFQTTVNGLPVHALLRSIRHSCIRFGYHRSTFLAVCGKTRFELVANPS